MGWNEEMREERDVLQRIVALLLALAGLADRAAVASGPKRRRALWALRQADAVTRELLAGQSFDLAGQQWSPDMDAIRCGDAPADASGLATAMRMLAFVVRIMALRIRSRSTWTCGSLQSAAGGPVEAFSAAFVAVGPCDTS
jgi:hypothetical protein